MKGSLLLRSTIPLVFIAVLTRAAGAALKPFSTVLADDGTQYSFYRTSSLVTASAASATCVAAGATLASFTSAEQVLSTLWSPDVVEAATEDTALIWTGLKITWPTSTAASHHRRRLRGTHALLQTDHIDDADNDGLTLLERLANEMDASTDFVVPTHTHDGRRRLPQLVRLWLFQQRILTTSSQSSQARRALLARDGTSPYLDNAKLSWADGSDTGFVMSNPSNMGFLACNPKKVSQCCGAVFDIGPDPYPGSDFPTIFFYPCGAQKVSGATPPSGFVCATASEVAELPRSGGLPPPSKSASPSPSPSPAPATKKCSPGSAPAAKGSSHSCVKCKANMFSDDGTKCKKCPAGTSSVKGASACN